MVHFANARECSRDANLKRQFRWQTLAPSTTQHSNPLTRSQSIPIVDCKTQSGVIDGQERGSRNNDPASP